MKRKAATQEHLVVAVTANHTPTLHTFKTLPKAQKFYTKLCSTNRFLQVSLYTGQLVDHEIFTQQEHES